MRTYSWDVETFATNSEAISLLDPQREEMDRRLDDLDHEGPTGIPCDDVLHRIRNREL